MSSPWFLRQPAENPRIRLICFPYTGGGATMYATWNKLVPNDVDVMAIQLPGRQSRMNEPPIDDPLLVTDLVVEAILPFIKHTPFIIFGYSMGGDTAMLVANKLVKEHNLSPLAMVFAATPALHRYQPPEPLLTTYDENEFPSQVSKYFGLDEQTSSLLGLTASYVRADIRSMERLDGIFEPSDPPQFTCPFIVFAGKTDHIIPEETTRAMKDYTSGPFTYRLLNEGHFFNRSKKFLNLLSGELSEICESIL
ncbi:putative Thioesterase PikA5 [Blattamonas nauphoetae]|uniref:Thioesterase PikA5 n=1 Tax=Blattamonas nauphoetae TaxID=2049346 RepID=A0ABQ9Y693_9EUKA|nr:putative Thioesterase PikA5 [Blattamonas nauphoetae]